MEHAKLSASGSSRWLNCPGSIRLEEGYPEETNPAAEYGTAGHEVAEMCLSGGHIDAHMYLGHMCENGIVANYEMCEFVQQYLDFVWSSMAESEGYLFVETRVDFSNFVPEGFGTSDAFIVTHDTLHIIDLKLGRVPVYASGNTQARLYALGVLNHIGKASLDIEHIKMTIIQPTKDHIDEWLITKEELLDWAFKVVKPKAQEALQDNAALIPGVKQCEYCKAAGDCVALAKYCMDTITTGEIMEDKLPMRNHELMTAEDMATVLNRKQLIVKWLDKLEDAAKTKMQEGEVIPGFKLVEGVSRRAWDKDVDEDIIAQKLLECGIPDDKCYTNKLISPSNAEKLLGKHYDEIKELVLKPTGKPTIARETDKRVELNTNVLYDFKND